MANSLVVLEKVIEAVLEMRQHEMTGEVGFVPVIERSTHPLYRKWLCVDWEVITKASYEGYAVALLNPMRIGVVVAEVPVVKEYNVWYNTLYRRNIPVVRESQDPLVFAGGMLYQLTFRLTLKRGYSVRFVPAVEKGN